MDTVHERHGPEHRICGIVVQILIGADAVHISDSDTVCCFYANCLQQCAPPSTPLRICIQYLLSQMRFSGPSLSCVVSNVRPLAAPFLLCGG